MQMTKCHQTAADSLSPEPTKTPKKSIKSTPQKNNADSSAQPVIQRSSSRRMRRSLAAANAIRHNDASDTSLEEDQAVVDPQPTSRKTRQSLSDDTKTKDSETKPSKGKLDSSSTEEDEPSSSKHESSANDRLTSESADSLSPEPTKTPKKSIKSTPRKIDPETPLEPVVQPSSSRSVRRSLSTANSIRHNDNDEISLKEEKETIDTKSGSKRKTRSFVIDGQNGNNEQRLLNSSSEEENKPLSTRKRVAGGKKSKSKPEPPKEDQPLLVRKTAESEAPSGNFDEVFDDDTQFSVESMLKACVDSQMKQPKMSLDADEVEELVKDQDLPKSGSVCQTPEKSKPPATDFETPTGRPSRHRKATARFGIDDLTLQEALTPSPKMNRLSRRRQVVKEPSVRTTPELHILTSDEGLLIRDALVKQKPELVSPPHWKVVENQETPDGQIKIKINRSRQLASNKNTPESLSASGGGGQRVSRRMASEIGISAEELRQVMYKSPSPKKRVVAGKENSPDHKSQLAAVAQMDKDKRKYSPLSSRSLYDLTTSPILNKSLGEGKPRSKASKKLY